jgi:putative nucleotidyltransferase with HDIG domain
MDTITTDVNKREKIEATLSKIYNLPALPDIVTEALKLLNSKKTTNQQLIELISKEQSFVTKVLALANSPVYGLRREVTTLDFAIMVLGYAELKHIVFVISFLESFKGSSSRHFDQDLYWLHSFLTAKVSKRIAEEYGYGKSGEAFVAGFLHDIGVSITFRYFKNSFIEIKEMAEVEDISFTEAEKFVLGMDHAELTNSLLKRWNLPSSLVRSTVNHHNPLNDNEDPMLAAIVNLSDYIAASVHKDKLFWEKGLVLLEDSFKVLCIPEEKQEDFINKYIGIVGDENEVMGILN